MFSFIHKFSSNVLDKCCEISLQMLQFVTKNIPRSRKVKSLSVLQTSPRQINSSSVQLKAALRYGLMNKNDLFEVIFSLF